MDTAPTYSVLVPCYLSEQTVEELTTRVLAVFDDRDESVELIFIDDASPDNVAKTVLKLRERDSRIKLIRHFRNYGQHNAVLTGMRHATGAYIITLDDDLQNPPEEIPKLIDNIGNSDVVVGFPEGKMHSSIRNLGSALVVSTIRYVFKMPKDFRASSFRLLRALVAKQMANLRTGYPYIATMLLLITTNLVYVPVRHDPRKHGRSNYSISRIMGMVGNILFNYSSIPLRIIVFLGILISILSIVALIAIVLAKILLIDFNAGWTSLISTIVFFSGLNLITLSIIGEYVLRLLNQVSGTREIMLRATYLKQDDRTKAAPDDNINIRPNDRTERSN